MTLPGGLYIGDARVDIYGQPDGLEVDNVTMPGHLLYFGFVSRVATVTDDGIYLTTYGYGTNLGGSAVALANQIFGPKLFATQDNLTKQYFSQHFGGN